MKLVLPLEPLPISSRDLRKRLAAGQDVSAELPDAVAALIRAGHLYAPPAGYTGGSQPNHNEARRIAALAQDKLARDVVILDMRPVCAYTDFFVVCTGNNPRQVKAIWDEVHGR